MKRWKRWTTALVSRIDHVAAQVENHQALAESVIGDVRRAAARAKVQLARVLKDGERLARDLGQRREDEIRWRERARQCAESDEKRAIECLRRSKASHRQIPEIERRLEEHRKAETQLGRDVGAIEERLATLREQRNLMRTRQSRAEAMSQVAGAESVGCGDLEEVFDRWDTRITELELDGDSMSHVDSLELEFEETEETEDLLAELAELQAS